MKKKLQKKFRLLLTVFIMLFSFGAIAQTITVKGTVISGEEKEPIPGVNVVIKGTSTGTITDIDGAYNLEVKAGEIVAFSFIGYLTEEVTITTSADTYDMILVPDLVDMDEVVVIGYGTQKKSDLTGAVSTVSSEEINRKPVATIEQSMQGLTAGVSVTSNTGAPGEGAVVRIRGVGSINSSNPLYVIDGVPVEGPNSTNPADIESISVLKDAAAASIYGARGANGVIIITTKKGKKGFHVNFESQFGVQKEWKRVDLLESEDYAKLVNEIGYNKGRSGPDATIDPYNQEFNTDWQEEMFQTAPMQRYNLSMSGATDDFNYSVSGGYLNQQGIMISTGYEKWFGRVNSEYKKGIFRFGENVAINSSDKDNEKNSVGGRNQIERMLKITPNLPVYDTAEVGGFAGPTSYHGHDAVNPVGVANLYEDNTSTTGILGNVFGEVQILPGLTYKLTYGFDYYEQESNYYEPEYTMGDYAQVGEPNWSDTYNTSNYSLIENLLTYSNSIQQHNFTALLGYSQERRSYETQNNLKRYYPVNDSTAFIEGQEFLYESGIVSYFGRVNYDFAGKYLFQANIRRDGSSKFGENKRWGLFPSFSGGWVISKESFMEAQSAISFFKIRGSWGTLGNQAINDYMYEASLNPYQRYTLDDQVLTGVGPSSFPNPNVQWETSIQSNIGADISFMANKINITAEYYHNTTEDMLINITMPLSNGSFQFPPQNAGSVLNNGFELMVNYKEHDKKFKYSLTGNITTIHNEVIDLGAGGKPIYGGYSELGNSTKTAVGQPIGSFFGYVTDGIYKSQEEIDAMNQGENIFAPNAQPGDIRFKDLDGDGLLGETDRDFIGSPIPKLTYGFNFSASYGEWDASMSFQGVYGNDIYRETKVWTEGMYHNFNASTDANSRYRSEDLTITRDGIDVFYPANTDTDMPWAIKSDPNKNALLFSDRFIEDGSYFRLKDLTVGYNLSKSALDKLKLGSLRFYLTGMNLLTITKYSGFDPEIGGGNTDRGIDNGYYPQAKAFMGGIQLGF